MTALETKARALILDYLRFCDNYDKAKECAIFTLNVFIQMMPFPNDEWRVERGEDYKNLIEEIKKL